MTAMITSPAPLIVVISAILVLAATGNLFAASPYVIAAQALAVALSVWARRSFPKGAFRVAAAPGAPAIIRRGPYRLLRHPMYSAVLIFIWAAVLGHPSRWTMLLGGLVTLVVSLRVIAEERLLRTRYPDYDVYARSTKAVIPFIV
jgi:protein-S-isoprenylcysteine O-methyltransferase Ste14